MHIRDMSLLFSFHPDIHQEFTNGYLVVHKIEKVFSSIALDQVHEQVNAQVKGKGGAVGLTENSAALRRWMIAGLEVARIIQEFKETSSKEVSEEKRRHHGQTPCVQAAFKKEVLSLVSAIEETGNPFQEDSTDLLLLDSKEIIDETVVKAVREVVYIGQDQYKAFDKERFKERTKSTAEAIKKNKLPLFKQLPQKNPTKDKQEVAALKDVRAHCYCASLVRTLFIGHASATSFSSARTESKTQQNIELMTFALLGVRIVLLDAR